MAEEEKKELVEEEAPEKEEPAKEEQPALSEEGNKHTLITFILSVVGLVLAGGWIVGSIAGLVLGVIALKRCNGPKPTKQPFMTFRKIARPVAIVDIILDAVMIVVWTVIFVAGIVAAAAAAANA